MYILGIYNGHDSSATLIKDGEVIASVQEERFNRIKHYAGLPVRAVDFCLSAGGISVADLDYIATPRIRNTPDIDTLFGNPKSGFLEVEELQDKSLKWYSRKLLISLMSLINAGNQFGLPLYAQKYTLNKNLKIIHIEHHLAHAASAYYTSGFDRCLVVTADGSGDALSQTMWLGENGKLKPLQKIGRNGSLGFFYNIITEALGWQVSEGEGKTMGLAPYGHTKNTKDKLNFCLPFYESGKLKKPYNFGFPKLWIDSGVYHWHFSESEIVKKLIEKYGRENIAAEAQRCLEEQMINFINPTLKAMNIRKLAVAGGTFLNVKMNQKISEECDLDDFYVFPDAGDGGTPLGAALFTYYNQAKQPYIPKKISDIYWGSSYADQQIKYFLDLQKIKYKKLEKRILAKTVAKLLSEGKIIGWFQGKMEVGPRALGNRSILMDPRFAKNKDIINKQVKFRESFRPFTPSLTPEGAQLFIDHPKEAPFMIISFNASEKKELIPAVVHIDGTLRPQVIERTINPLYYDLINEFGDLTGVPVLLNTSFNIKGEPVVESPRDAIKCFFDTGLDYLIMGNYVIKK